MLVKLDFLVFFSLIKVLVLDCEMVGVGFSGEESIVVRVFVVN